MSCISKPGWIPHLSAFSPAHNGFLKFTSSVMPADLLMASMAASGIPCTGIWAGDLPHNMCACVTTTLIWLQPILWVNFCLRCELSIEFFTITQSWQCWHYCQLCVPTYFQFSSLIASTDVSTCEISNQGVCEDYILRLNATLVWLIFKGWAKTKLATLAFLCCRETVKNSIAFLSSVSFITLYIIAKYVTSLVKRILFHDLENISSYQFNRILFSSILP